MEITLDKPYWVAFEERYANLSFTTECILVGFCFHCDVFERFWNLAPGYIIHHANAFLLSGEKDGNGIPFSDSFVTGFINLFKYDTDCEGYYPKWHEVRLAFLRYLIRNDISITFNDI